MTMMMSHSLLSKTKPGRCFPTVTRMMLHGMSTVRQASADSGSDHVEELRVHCGCWCALVMIALRSQTLLQAQHGQTIVQGKGGASMGAKRCSATL